jgi:hypothetical protein
MVIKVPLSMNIEKICYEEGILISNLRNGLTSVVLELSDFGFISFRDAINERIITGKMTEEEANSIKFFKI